LTPAARRYWDARPRLLRAGALYAGRLETWLARGARALQRRGALAWPRACFAVTGLAEQRALLARHRPALVAGERGFALLLHPVVSWLAIQDPSFLRSSEGNPGRCLYRRLLAWAEGHVLGESFLLHLIYFGRYDRHGALPLWLTPEGYEAARKRLARLSLVQADVAGLPRRVGGGANVHWSLSDVSCWMSERRFHDLLRAISAASPAGSRVCWRNLAAVRGLPPGEPRLRRLDALCRALDRDDASVFYRFEVAQVGS
jgi:S-adenosylmethionine:diacylglycerol 3-amino-3-carboxypropyl transferase